MHYVLLFWVFTEFNETNGLLCKLICLFYHGSEHFSNEQVFHSSLLGMRLFHLGKKKSKTHLIRDWSCVEECVLSGLETVDL